jgi:hypothetical protein
MLETPVLGDLASELRLDSDRVANRMVRLEFVGNTEVAADNLIFMFHVRKLVYEGVLLCNNCTSIFF